MRKIKIKCSVSNDINIYRFHIMIYNSNHKLIFDKFTNKFGEVIFKAPYFGIYKIVITSEKYFVSNKICTNFLVNNRGCNILLFTFQKQNFNNYRLVTFKLTDKHYKDLKVQKGDSILWQKNI